jgi:hypothetical protein
MKASFLTLFSAALALAGCSSSEPSDSTASAGVNSVTRRYAKPASDVYGAALSTVKAYDLTLDSDHHDNMGGELVAHRAAGDRVTIRVRGVDDQTSDASIRIDPGNRNLANLLHERIAEKLGMGMSKSGVVGDTWLSGTYPADLQRCISAADAALRNFGMSVTNKDVRDKAAVIDARESNSNPVRIGMDRSSDAGTKVTFSAGNAGGSDPKTLTSKLKVEFEHQLGQSAIDPR